MLRRDRYQPEIKLYYVEKSWTAEVADEQEDKFKDSHTKDLASTGPDIAAACDSSDGEGSSSCKGKGQAKGNRKANSRSQNNVQGSMQRELAFEVHF